MSRLATARSPRACWAILALAAPAWLAAPSVAFAAKLQTAKVSDPAGDAPSGAVDIVSAVVRYSAKGSLSLSVTMKDPIAPATDDAQLLVQLSDLKNGKCRNPLLAATATLSAPQAAYAFTAKGKGYGTPVLATATITGNVFSLRVKSRAFRKKTLGCAHVALAEAAVEAPTVLDQTSGTDRFS